MTFEEFMLAVAEDPELRETLWHMATQQSEEVKTEVNERENELKEKRNG